MYLSYYVHSRYFDLFFGRSPNKTKKRVAVLLAASRFWGASAAYATGIQSSPNQNSISELRREVPQLTYWFFG